jgi:hypothetical protein
MEAKFEDGSSYPSLKSLIPDAFNMGVIHSTLGWRLPYLGSWNPSESVRIRLATESVRIRNRPTQRADVDEALHAHLLAVAAQVEIESKV